MMTPGCIMVEVGLISIDPPPSPSTIRRKSSSVYKQWENLLMLPVVDLGNRPSSTLILIFYTLNPTSSQLCIYSR